MVQANDNEYRSNVLALKYWLMLGSKKLKYVGKCAVQIKLGGSCILS